MANKCHRRGVFSELKLYASHDWGVIIQNTQGTFSLLLRCHFLHTFGHNFQTIWCTKRLGYYRRRYFLTLELCASFDWRVTSPNAHCDRFFVRLLRCRKRSFSTLKRSHEKTMICRRSLPVGTSTGLYVPLIAELPIFT